MDAEKPNAENPQESDWVPEERISWFPIPDEEDLDPRVAELVAKQREKLGAPKSKRTPKGRSESAGSA